MDTRSSVAKTSGRVSSVHALAHMARWDRPQFLQMTVVVSLLKNAEMEESFSPVPAPAAPGPSVSKFSAHPLGQSLKLTATVGN